MLIKCRSCTQEVPFRETSVYGGRCEDCYAGNPRLPPRTGFILPADSPPITQAPRGEEFKPKTPRSAEVRARISASVRASYARRGMGRYQK